MPTRLVDARGRKVTQLDPVEQQMLHRSDVVDVETLRRIAAEIGPGVPRRQTVFFWACFVLGSAGLVLAIVRAWAIGRSLDTVGRVLWVVNAVCLVVGLVGIWSRGRRGRFARVRDTMLRHDRCPHCGYDLHGLHPDPEDGATVCPECGCAWRVPARASEDHEENTTGDGALRS
jgi:hypothetical protein